MHFSISGTDKMHKHLHTYFTLFEYTTVQRTKESVAKLNSRTNTKKSKYTHLYIQQGNCEHIFICMYSGLRFIIKWIIFGITTNNAI